MILNAGTEPVGTFQCIECGRIWDGSELRYRKLPDGRRYYYCYTITCEASVKKINDEPKPGPHRNVVHEAI
jgi:hypothetical protein